MHFSAEQIVWDAPAGQRLDWLARNLPSKPRLEITVFGSAPLQLFLDRGFLSADIDIFATEETYDFLLEFVTAHELDQPAGSLYLQVCDPYVFRSTRDWRDRSIEVDRCGHLFRFVHPWDILVSKLARLDEKDIRAFRLVIDRTGHPTEPEFLRHLQLAVDLFRPRFDEEGSTGDIFAHTALLWKMLWQMEIDVRAQIIRPAMERQRGKEAVADPALKARLGQLKLPEDEV